MYATVRTYECVPDPVKAGRRVRETLVPLISEIDGFIAYYWVDAGYGVMVSISVFEDQVGAEASNARAADWVRENPEVLPRARHGSPQAWSWPTNPLSPPTAHGLATA
jgi:hypothetical protein